jgi:CBS domain-containing protein
MICPHCGHVNLPGSDECEKCQQDLAPFDLPVGHDRVEISIMNDPVSILRPKLPVTVPETSTLGYALQVMIEREIGAVMVVDTRQQLVGILTERDFLQKVVGNESDYAHLPVTPVMTTSPETVGPDDPLAAALYKMDVGGYRHLPVVAEGMPIGIISVRDVIRHVTRLCREKPVRSIE